MLQNNINIYYNLTTYLFRIFINIYFLLKNRTRLFESLRMLPHAPSVQMSDIPADGITLKEETDDADPDKRNPQQIKDKQIEPDNEFEESGVKSGNRDVNNGKEEPMEVDKPEANNATINWKDGHRIAFAVGPVSTRSG